jgi:hypothetical protein
MEGRGSLLTLDPTMGFSKRSPQQLHVNEIRCIVYRNVLNYLEQFPTIITE